MTPGELADCATLAAGLRAGASTYLQLGVNPAVVAGLAAANPGLQQAVRHGTMLQVGLTVAAGGAALEAWWLGAGPAWLVGAIPLLTVVAALTGYLGRVGVGLVALPAADQGLGVVRSARRWMLGNAASGVIQVACCVLFTVVG